MQQRLSKVKKGKQELTVVTMWQQRSTNVMNGQLGSTKVKKVNKGNQGAKGAMSGNKEEQWLTSNIKK